VATALDLPSTRAGAAAELVRLELEVKRRYYLAHPDRWAAHVLGATLWSKQRDMLESVRVNRKTVVRSCHGAGKSFNAAVVVAWWLSSHKPGEAFVVTSAPTGRQVRAVLWREINRAHARGGLPGRTNQTEWLMPNEDGVEELVAFGQKPADMDPTAFQGIHAPALLVIFDEACGIPESLWIAADSLTTNDECRFLALGNPDDPMTELANVCKPGSGWNVISISAFDTPNFTGEQVPAEVSRSLVNRTWVEDKRRRWAPRWTWAEDGRSCVPPREGKVEDTADPMWFSKVLGQFPSKGGPLSLIPETWIEQAQERALARSKPHEFGGDVGAGGDASTVAEREGPVVRIVHSDHNPNTMETCGNFVAVRRRAAQAKGMNAHRAREITFKVDKIGIGAGIVDRANEAGEGFIGINVGESATDGEKFENRRAENWWGLRERFESGDVDIDPEDLELAAELSSIRYKRTSRGRIQIESKEEAMKRGVRSPNRADAVMLAFAPIPSNGMSAGLVW